MDPRTNAFACPLPEADGELLDLVQSQTFRFFWEGAHRQSGLARDRQKTTGDPDNDLIAIGGSGFGIMAIVVAVERGWVSRDEAVARLGAMLSCLEETPRYHGMFPHFINGRTAETIPFSRKDDGGDVVETAFLFQGLLCARQYFDRAANRERDLCRRIDPALAWSRMGLVQARRRRQSLLALEPQARLGDEPENRRLE